MFGISDDFIEQCVNHFGSEGQLDILQEECAELITACANLVKACSKVKRKKRKCAWKFKRGISTCSHFIRGCC